jgi:hypothetical protein
MVKSEYKESEVNKVTDDIKESQEKCRCHAHRMLDYRLRRTVLSYTPRGKGDLERP